MATSSNQRFCLRKYATLIVCVATLSGCSSSLPTDTSSQLDYACIIINNWPIDYATVWPQAVLKHNASPETVSAAEYMKGYVEIQSGAFGISDPEAVSLIERYKDSWNFLELDLLIGGGVMPSDPVSPGVVGKLMQYCDDTGRGFKE